MGDKSEEAFQNLKMELDTYKEKIKSIKVHTGKIAINDPSAWYRSRG